MGYVPTKYTDAEILAEWELKAVHWENEARNSPPDVAIHCLDYAKHIRTMAECLRMDLLEKVAHNNGYSEQYT